MVCVCAYSRAAKVKLYVFLFSGSSGLVAALIFGIYVNWVTAPFPKTKNIKYSIFYPVFMSLFSKQDAFSLHQVFNHNDSKEV